MMVTVKNFTINQNYWVTQLRSLIVALWVALAYYLIARWSLIFAFYPEKVPTFWPPSGFLFAILLLTRNRSRYVLILFTVLVSNALTNYVDGYAIGISLSLAAANCIEAALATYLITRFVRADISFERLWDVLGLIGLAALGSTAIAALLDTAVVLRTTGAPFWETWRIWWLASGTGMLLVTPALVGWATALRTLRAQTKRQIAEAILFFIAASLLTQLIFRDARILGTADSQPYMLFPLMIWAALRLGPRLTATSLLLVAMLVAWHTVQDVGLFAVTGITTADHVFNAQLYLGIMASAALILSTVITERRQIEATLREREGQLRNVVASNVDGMIILDQTSHIRFANPAAGTLFGRPIEKLIGSPWQMPIVHGGSLELEILKPNGDKSLVEMRMVETKWGNTPARLASLRDISARRRAEASLKESEEKLRQIASSINEVIWLQDAETDRVLYVNPTYEILWGKSREHLYENSLAFVEAVHPDDQERVQQALARQRADGTNFNEEYRIIRPGGSVRWVWGQSFAIKDQDGKIYRTVVLTEDITERKEIADTLRKSEDRYRRIVETAEEGIWVIDANAITTFVNQKLAEMLGYTVTEMLDQPLLNFMDEEGKQIVNTNFEWANTGSAMPQDFKLLRKDGNALWVMMSTSPLRDQNGHFAGALAMVTDIRERRQMENALREAYAYNRTLIETSPDPFITIHSDGTIGDVNTATEQITGYPREHLIGSNFLDYVVEPDKARELFEHVQTDGSVKNFELQIRHRDGHITSVLHNVTRYQEASGRPAGVLAIARDITERKKAEAQLQYFSTHDVLTGLYNRAYFDLELENLDRDRQISVSIVMVDVDGLKRTNDQHGHAAGDELLKRAAQVLKASFRARDVIARIGGDEFAIILPGADATGAAITLARVKQTLLAHNVAHPGEPLSFSIGIATGDKQVPLPETLKEADQRMYQDKAAKRVG